MLILGDFNLPEIDWCNMRSKKKMNKDFNTPVKFLNVLQQSGFYQHVKTPTRVRGNQTPSLLDLVITCRSDNVEQLEVMAPLGKSDHAMLSAKVLLPKGVGNRVGYQKEVWNYTKGDYAKAREMAKGIDWEHILENENIDVVYNNFVEHLHAIRNECIPRKKMSVKDPKHGWFCKRAKKLVKKKKQAWNAYIDAVKLNLSSRSQLYSRYIRIRQSVSLKIRKIKRRHENKLFQNVLKNPKLFYSYCNAKKVKPAVGEVKLPDGSFTTSHKMTARAFNNHFKSVFVHEDDASVIFANDFFQQHYQVTDCPFTGCVHKEVPTLEVVNFTVKEVYDSLKNLNAFKSPGPDLLHPRLLKELALNIAEPLWKIFQRSLQSGNVPQLWKMANITVIHKKGPKEEVSNYRPISLACIVSKLMEHIVKKNIMQHLLHHDLLVQNQHGFTNGRSCLTNLLQMVEYCSESLDQGLPTDIIYMDFAKAFDSVPHIRLCHKLRAIGISGSVLQWIEDFLCNRKQRVVVYGEASQWTDVLSGVPQGSVIGPCLFLIFINDISSTMNSHVSIFADDTKILRCIRSDEDILALQRDLETAGKWSREWKLGFNAKKCHVLRIGKPKDLEIRPQYELNGVILENVLEQSDLGVLIDSSLDFKKHVNRCINRAFTSWGIIRRTFDRLKPKMFKLLFKTYVRSHVEYCPQVWSPYKKGLIKRIERVQRVTTRKVIGMTGKSYDERLKEIKLTTLEERRNRGDMIEVHKILQKLHSVDLSDLFIVRSHHHRGSAFKLFKPRFRTVKRGHSFSQRTVNNWNKLTQQVHMAGSTTQFKRLYDKLMTEESLDQTS